VHWTALHYCELACYVGTFWVVLSHLLLAYVWCIMWYICIIHYTGQDEEGEVMCVSLPPPPPSNISWDQYINSPDEEYAAHSLTANTDTLCNFVVPCNVWVLWSTQYIA
jgi:hypothetical protein